jgi:hypothetical protein
VSSILAYENIRVLITLPNAILIPVLYWIFPKHLNLFYWFLNHFSMFPQDISTVLHVSLISIFYHPFRARGIQISTKYFPCTYIWFPTFEIQQKLQCQTIIVKFQWFIALSREMRIKIQRDVTGWNHRNQLQFVASLFVWWTCNLRVRASLKTTSDQVIRALNDFDICNKIKVRQNHNSPYCA